MIDAIIQKLSGEVAVITGRVQGALEFGALVEHAKVPPVTPAVFVIPGGMIGGSSSAAAGAFIQNTEDVVQVILALRSHDAVGARGLDPLKALIDAVLACLCGWRPTPTAPGVLVLQRGALVSLNAGLILFQIDLSLSNQLRIAR